MKKLILAPAVALAFTGLVAAPVAAAESPATQSASAKAEAKAEAEAEAKAEAEAEAKAEAKAEKLAKEKAEKEEAAEEEAAEEAKQKKADAKKAADKKAADKKAADKKKSDESTGDDKKSKKPTPKDDDSKKDDGSEAKDDDKNKDSKDAKDPKDDVENINASLKVATSSISAENLASEGIKVTVTGLEKGDKLTASGLTAPTTTVAADGSKSLTLDYSGDAEDLDEGKKSFSVKVQRAGVSAQTLSGSTNVMETQAAIDASLSVSPDEITAEDLSDPSKGATVTVSGAEEGDTITDSLTKEARTVDADGNFSLSVYYKGDPEDLQEGKQPFTVEVDREGEESETLDGEINVVDEVTEVNPEIGLSDTDISESDFNKDGITVTGTGFTPNGDVKINAGAGNSFFYNQTVTADDNGEVTVPLAAPDSGLAPGRYTVTATDVDSDEEAAEQAFTVTEDAVEAIDASLKVDPKEITAEDLANKDKGVVVTVSGVKKGDKITDSLTGEAETADADGDYKLHLYYKGSPNNLEEGKQAFTVKIDREGTDSETLKGNINIVAEDDEDKGDDGDNSDDGNKGDDGDDSDSPEAPAEAAFTVSPKLIEAADFVNKKKGVHLSVENCEPGSEVHFNVKPTGINVSAYDNTVTTDDEGKASVSVYGTSADASAYVGSYTASATCGDDTMKSSFKVTAGADGGGSDGNDNGNGNGSGDNGAGDGSQLPRTGADLGGIASGAILLLVGGAAIAMTGRRKKVGLSPSDF